MGRISEQYLIIEGFDVFKGPVGEALGVEFVHDCGPVLPASLEN